MPENAEGCIPLEHFDRAIDERTRLVAITHVCFRNGAKLDVAEIVRMAHACYAAAAGLDIILGLGLGDIEEHVRALSGRWQRARDVPLL